MFHAPSRKKARALASMDKLLRTVRERSDHRYHNIMPIRTPMRWAEAFLLNTTLKKTATIVEEREAPSQIQEPRRMDDSYSQLILSPSSDSQLLGLYMNAFGGLRIGKLTEHLDSLAGSIANKDMLGPGVETLGQIHERGFYIVTAVVERLDMLTQLNPSRDLRLSRQVIYTGKSSMEHIGSDQPEETVLLVVCRDAHAYKVNPLIVLTREERALYAIGEEIKER
ncbi:hypothetical protein JOM56_007879 [Amanita muscaria]